MDHTRTATPDTFPIIVDQQYTGNLIKNLIVFHATIPFVVGLLVSF